MSLLIPELVHGSCQYIPQETLAIPGKKSKGHLRLQAFMLLKNFRLCDGYKKISLFFDDRIFSMVFCKFFLYHYSFALFLQCHWTVFTRTPSGFLIGRATATRTPVWTVAAKIVVQSAVGRYIHKTKIVLILMYPYLYYIRLSLSGHFNEGFVKPLSI